MKILPAAVIPACAALLVSCGPKQTDNSTIEKQQQLIEQQQAHEERELHEREAELDEQQRLLNERQQQTTVAATPAAPAQAPVAEVQPPVAQPPATPPLQEAPASASDVSYQQFYDYLSPYGSWIQMTGYGYVWQPRAAQDPHWRPYTLGHWAYTDDGWTWVSDEPFGWIAYHYGRWMLTHTEGWVWFPGDQWAPAWVSWRYGNDFVGWAPLPPEARFDGAVGIKQWADQQYSLGASDYTFVPASEFGGDEMASIEVPPDQNGPIYDESTNITDIYDTGGVIYCYGPDYVFLSGRAHGHFPPKLKLLRTPYNTGGTNGFAVAGNTLQVTAPRIVPGRRAESPKTVREIGVTDARIVKPAGTPPPHGSVLPPLYRPPQAARLTASPAAQMQQPPAPPAALTQQRQAAPVAETQNERDVQIIQQRQAVEQAREAQNQAAAQEQQADQRRAADAQAAREQAAHDQAVREQAARDQATQQEAARAEASRQEAARQEAARQVQPATGNATNVPVVPGRNQQ